METFNDSPKAVDTKTMDQIVIKEINTVKADKVAKYFKRRRDPKQKIQSEKEIILETPSPLKSYKNTDIRSLIVPLNTTEISAGTFKNCLKLETVIINENCELIRTGAFDNCPKLKCVLIPKYCKVLPKAFIECKTSKLMYEQGSKNIPLDALTYNKAFKLKKLNKFIKDIHNFTFILPNNVEPSVYQHTFEFINVCINVDKTVKLKKMLINKDFEKYQDIIKYIKNSKVSKK